MNSALTAVAAGLGSTADRLASRGQTESILFPRGAVGYEAHVQCCTGSTQFIVVRLTQWCRLLLHSPLQHRTKSLPVLRTHAS